MMRRSLALAVSVLGLAACNGSDTTAPRLQAADAAARYFGGILHNGWPVPGSAGDAVTATAKPTQSLQCSVSAPLTGMARIGPAGGMMDIGPHRLIIPAGALTTDVDVKGVVPAGNTLQIQFYPEGLHFNKPAGLILDASSCAGVPDVVYINEKGGENEVIHAIFSEWWHVIAAPLDHFSMYVLMV
jgi:hypothetical protein